ncbi:MAG TPA: tail fiber domain-containing protein [Xanthomonadaceae bacterium]|nr:tail fiber domain-containing protein [Xanthomonadaceae bacterium]
MTVSRARTELGASEALPFHLRRTARGAAAASFTYRGSLEDAGTPAQGRYDLRLTLYSESENGKALDLPLELHGINVRDGRFVAAVDFAGVPAVVAQGWLEVAVRGVGDGDYWVLPGRQAVSLKAQLCPESWELLGNVDTNPDVNFLGTTDARALELRVENERALRISPLMRSPPGFYVRESRNLRAGHPANVVRPDIVGATIAGGGAEEFSFIGPVLMPNRVESNFGTVSGGFRNVAGHESSDLTGEHAPTVAGGSRNTASAEASTVSGGRMNMASASSATVTGGNSNLASGISGSVAGGGGNTASGSLSFVAGGNRNCAGGQRSWAAGTRAKVRPGATSGAEGAGCHEVQSVGDLGDFGTFVWADDQEADFVSTGPNQFLVRASGGMAINSDDPNGFDLRVNGSQRVEGVLQVASLAGFPTVIEVCAIDNGELIPCGPSSRELKSGIADLDLGLDTLLRLRPVAFRWIEGDLPDIGFIAEEVAEVDPRLVIRNAAGEVTGVRYNRVSVLLAQGLAGLHAEQQALRAEVLALWSGCAHGAHHGKRGADHGVAMLNSLPGASVHAEYVCTSLRAGTRTGNFGSGSWRGGAGDDARMDHCDKAQFAGVSWCGIGSVDVSGHRAGLHDAGLVLGLPKTRLQRLRRPLAGYRHGRAHRGPGRRRIHLDVAAAAVQGQLR